MMKKYLFFIITVSLFSCTSIRHDDFWFLDYDKNYNRVATIFDKYIGFFPSNKISNCISCTWSLNPKVEYNLKVIFSFSENNFKLKQQEIIKKSIAEYTVSDDSLLILNRFSTHENYGYPSEQEILSDIIEQDYFKVLKPIPNFSNFSLYQTNNNLCKLKDDFIIYVLEAKPGKFLEDQKLTKGKYMPSTWKNGYSKGVAISEQRKEMIFWVIIW